METCKCPVCDGALELEPGAGAATCGGCGAALRLTWGTSGPPLVEPAGEDASSAFLRRRAVIGHLRDRLEDMAAQRKELEAQVDREANRAVVGLSGDSTRTLVAVLLAGGGIALTALVLCVMAPSLMDLDSRGAACFLDTVFCLAPSALLTAAAVAFYRRARAAEERKERLFLETRLRTKKALAPRLAQLDEEIGASRARIDRLTEEADRLARELD